MPGLPNRISKLCPQEWSAIEAEGILIPAAQKHQYRFAHDSIQKLIYNQLDDSAKQNLHIQIGRFLNGQHETESEAGAGEHAFDAVNHLNRGAKLVADPAERLQLVKLNLEAGTRAKASSAYDVALGYFHNGVEQLNADDWETSFELCFDLYAQKAECEYMCGNYEISEET